LSAALRSSRAREALAVKFVEGVMNVFAGYAVNLTPSGGNCRLDMAPTRATRA
jgi:hypothetical protein